MLSNLITFLRTGRWKRSNIDPSASIAASVIFDRQWPEGIHVEKQVVIQNGAVLLTLDTGTLTRKAIHIRAGANIGPRAIIMPGVTVGEGSIVRAGSVVDCDVPDHAIVMGNPARRLV